MRTKFYQQMENVCTIFIVNRMRKTNENKINFHGANTSTSEQWCFMPLSRIGYYVQFFFAWQQFETEHEHALEPFVTLYI